MWPTRSAASARAAMVVPTRIIDIGTVRGSLQQIGAGLFVDELEQHSPGHVPEGLVIEVPARGWLGDPPGGCCRTDPLGDQLSGALAIEMHAGPREFLEEHVDLVVEPGSSRHGWRPCTHPVTKLRLRRRGPDDSNAPPERKRARNPDTSGDDAKAGDGPRSACRVLADGWATASRRRPRPMATGQAHRFLMPVWNHDASIDHSALPSARWQRPGDRNWRPWA
jgi:hypothetical protein